MKLPLNVIHLVPASVCWSPSCVPAVLNEPPILSVPVLDTIGIEYGFDVQFTQGFYVIVAAYVTLRLLQGALIEYVRARRDNQGDE